MKSKRGAELDPLDLATRARRGARSPREREAVADAVATSATLRTAHELSCDFELVSRVLPGDEAIIERALDRALTPQKLPTKGRFRRSAALIAATLALGSVAAAASGGIAKYAGFQSAGPTAPGPTERGRQQAAQTASRPSQNVAREAPAPAPRDAAGLSYDASPEPRSAGTSSPLAASPGAASEARPRVAITSNKDSLGAPSTAASLFADASAARREGDLNQARRLYLELQARFPASREASVSRVSVGKLLASEGRAREAEAAFAAYLRSGALDLREEALVGRADALRALGRTADERSAREELIRLHPASVHAVRARERLAELDATSATRGR
jgi:TolA-binding protein